MLFSSRCLAFLFVVALPTLGFGQSPAQAQDRTVGVQTAFARAQHLKRGINVSHWFSQHAQDYSARHTDAETNADDIALIARLGFDNVRLSIDATPLEQWPMGPDGLNAEFMSRLDKAVDTMLADGLAVQVDLHPEDSYKQQLRSSDDAVERLVMLWRKLAAHYASRDPERVFFEILNEPEVYDQYRWAGIQARVAAAIREAAPKNTIIATGAGWSNIVDLLALRPLLDGNVIYNFHFYDPHEFTHQGAYWGDPLWVFEHKIPYPATEITMKEHLAEVPDSAGRYKLELYWLDHWDAHRIQLLIDEAAAWGWANHVPVISNEFGVYRRVADPASRNAWIRDARTALEADGIGWAMWDYHGGFGVVADEKQRPAEPDPATVEALGLKP
jgi:aryl-phospho-beta-D-glucosidase BglC (GH1 family)